MKKFNVGDIKKFNVGDIIVYNYHIYNESDNGREQLVVFIEIEDDYERYHTEFLDNGRRNNFVIGSPYYDACKVVGSQFNYQYDNGVPIIWEDVI